jgi:hypothetical protein
MNTLRSLQKFNSFKISLLILVIFAIYVRFHYVKDLYNSAIEDMEETPPAMFVAQDSRTHFAAAINMMNGRGYSSSVNTKKLIKDTSSAPVFSGIMAIFNTVFGVNEMNINTLQKDPTKKIFKSRSFIPLTLFNHILGILTIILLSYGIYLISGSILLSFIGCVLYICSRNTFQTINTLLPYALAILINVSIIVSFIKFRMHHNIKWLWYTALLISLGAITKNITFNFWILLLCLLVSFFKSRLSLKHLIIFVIIAQLLPSLWVVRNGLVSNHYVSNTYAGIMWLIRPANYVLASKKGIPLSQSMKEWEKTAQERVIQWEQEKGRIADEYEKSNIWGEVGKEFIINNWVWTLKVYWHGLNKLVDRYKDQNVVAAVFLKEEKWIPLKILFILSIIGTIFLLYYKKYETIFVLLFIGLPLVAVTGPVYQQRHIAIWLPYFYLLAFSGFGCFVVDMKKLSTKQARGLGGVPDGPST